MPGRLGDLELPADLAEVLALVEQLVTFGELSDDLFGGVMKQSLKAIAPLVASALVIAAVATFNVYSSKASASPKGYDLLVGNVRPCAAKQYDALPSDPLIVILTKDAATYDTYNITADPGTTSYPFDVPAGDYQLTTTWPKSRDFHVVVRYSKTTRLNFAVSCGLHARRERFHDL